MPKQLFMFPVKLVEFLNEKKINTVCWVVSALTMISAFKTFDKVVPQYLRTVAFGSEVFPIKQFNLWREPCRTRVSPTCTAPRRVHRDELLLRGEPGFGPDDAIPIGRPFQQHGDPAAHR